MPTTTPWGVIDTETVGGAQVQKVILRGDTGEEINGTNADGVFVDVRRIRGNNSVTRSSVSSASVGPATVKAANASRKGLILFNRTNVEAYIGFGANPTVSDFSSVIPPNTEWFMPVPGYEGAITVLFAATDGTTNAGLYATEW